MNKFKKLVMVGLGGYLLILACMLLMFMGHSSSVLWLVLISLNVVMLIFDMFLLYYFFSLYKKEKK